MRQAGPWPAGCCFGLNVQIFERDTICLVRRLTTLLSPMDLLDPEISGDTVMRLIPSMLADGDDRLLSATSILQRLQANLDSKAVSRNVLRLLCAHCNGEDFLVDLLLDFMQTYEEPLHIIELMSIAAADVSESKIESILEAYKSLIVENRKVLVPVIGSISELSLSKRQRASFLSLVKGALSVLTNPTLQPSSMPFCTSLTRARPACFSYTMQR